MQLFLYSGKSRSFLNKLVGEANQCPVLGDSASNEVIGLAHYSKDPDIPEFYISHDYNWTRRVCDQQRVISELTQKGDIKYNTVYVIRVGISSKYPIRKSTGGITEEYALGMPVARGDFARIPLVFDEQLRVYSAASSF